MPDTSHSHRKPLLAFPAASAFARRVREVAAAAVLGGPFFALSDHYDHIHIDC